MPHIVKIAILQKLNNKIDKLTDMLDLTPVNFPHSVVTSMQHVCYLFEDNKSGSSVNKLRYS